MTGAYLGAPRRRPQLYEPADSEPPALEQPEPTTETAAFEATPTDADPAGARAALQQRIHARRNQPTPAADEAPRQPPEAPADEPALPVIRVGGRRPQSRRGTRSEADADDLFPARHIADGGRRPTSPLTRSVEETP